MNSIYDSARVRLLSAQFNWVTMNLVLSAWAGVKSFVATDQTLADLKARGGVERAFSLPITAKTVSIDGTAQTNVVVIPAVPIGQDITWLTMSEVNAAHDASKPVLFIDETTPLLPFVPNGLDMVVMPDWALNRGWWKP